MANLEYRFKIVGIFEGAAFTDAGNIWTIKNYDFQPQGKFQLSEFYKQIAWSYGLGLRMVPVTSANSVMCLLKDIPVGSGGLYVYQDLNGNHQLDKDESQIPIEPCYQKERVTIKEGENKIEIRLIDVKEMMGTK